MGVTRLVAAWRRGRMVGSKVALVVEETEGEGKGVTRGGRDLWWVEERMAGSRVALGETVGDEGVPSPPRWSV